MLLFGLTAPRRWVLVSVLVAAATVGLNMFTGATWNQVAIFVVSNVTQAICAVLILRALAHHLQGAGGDQPLEQLLDFWSIIAGIGLSVCKRIVERHGGQISARPALGERGSRIVFTLPAASAG